MKSLMSFILIVSLLISTSPMIFAADNNTDSATYIDQLTGDVVSVEAVFVSADNMKEKKMAESTYTTCIKKNGVVEEFIFVDFENDKLRQEYPDGSVHEQSLSTVVKVSNVDPSQDDHMENTLSDTSTRDNPRTDFIDNEPLSVSSSGVQVVLTGVPTIYGYQAMGYRGGYDYAPTTYGYLQRNNAGVEGTYHSNLFSFTAGTTIGVAASIIVALFTSTNVLGLTLSIAVAILGMIIDTVSYDWNAVFEVKTYKWLYRVRLNSNTGTIIHSNYRTQDYWKGYNAATGEASYHYRGTAYDWGFLLSNSEMIKVGIDSYLNGTS